MQNNSDNQPTIKTEEFKCDVCGEEFGTISELESHKYRHGHPALGRVDQEHETRGDIGAAGLPTSPMP